MIAGSSVISAGQASSPWRATMTPQETIPSSCKCGKRDCTIPYGYCHCECGELTRIAAVNCTSSNDMKGVPRCFVKGHQRKIRPKIEDAVPFKIDGVYCRLIPLTQGQYAIVDAEDYKWLMEWKWSAGWSEGTRSFYAIRKTPKVDGKQGDTISMHRQVMGLGPGDEGQVDHDNHNTTDNRRGNLRPADDHEQSYNRRKYSNNTSGFKGVSYRTDKKVGKWRARIMADGKRITLGYFPTKEAAWKSYCDAAVDLHKDFMCVK